MFSRRFAIASLRFVLVFTLVILALPASAYAVKPAAATDPVVSGTVSGSDGLAIPGATVAVYELNKGLFRLLTTLTTDGSGSWSFTDKPNTYRFDVSAANADGKTDQLIMVKGGVYALSTTLMSYGSIVGTITQGGTTDPIEGATVEFYRRNVDGTWQTVPWAAVSTAADGTFSSGALPAATYAVKARATGWIEAFFGGTTIDVATPVAVLRGGSPDASFGLEAVGPTTGTGSISGVVVHDAVRTPDVGAYVWLYRQNDDGTWPATSPYWGSPTYTVYTTTGGAYTSGPIPLGNYRVRFFTTHTGSQWWQYVATFDEATDVTLTYDGQTIAGIEGWFNKP